MEEIKMYFKLKSKIGCLLVVFTLLMSMFGGLPVMAADGIEVILTDVTNSNTSTKTGDAKLLIPQGACIPDDNSLKSINRTSLVVRG